MKAFVTTTLAAALLLLTTGSASSRPARGRPALHRTDPPESGVRARHHRLDRRPPHRRLRRRDPARTHRPRVRHLRRART